MSDIVGVEKTEDELHAQLAQFVHDCTASDVPVIVGISVGGQLHCGTGGDTAELFQLGAQCMHNVVAASRSVMDPRK